jgi:hypothetical protein
MICVQYFFPEHPVENAHPSTIKLRKCLVNLILGHIICLVVLILYALITAFIAQLLYIAILYSLYMTLRQWIIFLYIGCLCLNIFLGLFNVFVLSGMSLFMYFLVLFYYGVALKIIWMYSEDYR